jgi:hypothetical protein
MCGLDTVLNQQIVRPIPEFAEGMW